MATTRHVIICTLCQKDIDDDYLAFLWQDICKSKGLYKKLVDFTCFCHESQESIRELELKGYITSTDIGDRNLRLKPKGENEYHSDCYKSEGLLYCINPKEHFQEADD